MPLGLKVTPPCGGLPPEADAAATTRVATVLRLAELGHPVDGDKRSAPKVDRAGRQHVDDDVVDLAGEHRV